MSYGYLTAVSKENGTLFCQKFTKASAILPIGKRQPRRGLNDDLAIDYKAAASPPLAVDAAAWADELLRAAGLR